MKIVDTIIMGVLLCACAVFCQWLVKAEIIDGKVSILVPKGFVQMSEEMMKLKYPSERRPTFVLTNKSGSINVAFNHTQNKASQDNIGQYKKVFEKTFKNLYPSAKWIGVGVKRINGRKVGFQEMITPAVDTKIYNLMFFTDLDGRLLLCTFNCTVKDKKVWQKSAHEIMNSLTVL